MIRVFIVDDHPMVAAGLARLLEESPTLTMAGVEHSVTSARTALERTRPDVVLLDIHVGEGYGPDLMRWLQKQPWCPRILFFTVLPENAFALQLIEEGAAGFLNKSATIAEMVTAITAVAAGKLYLSEELRLLALDLPGTKGGSALDTLSPREREVLVLLVRGRRQVDIQEALNLGHGAVSTYVARLQRKLGVKTLPELIRLALQQGLGEG